MSYAFYVYRTHYMLDSFPVLPFVLPFVSQCKWLLSSSVLAFALAFGCDNKFDANEEPRWQRWAEGAGIAALMGLAGYLVVLWLASDRVALYAGAPIPRLWLPVLLNAGIGAVFGSTVPHWYRSIARSGRATAATAPEFAKPRVSEPQAAAV